MVKNEKSFVYNKEIINQFENFFDTMTWLEEFQLKLIDIGNLNNTKINVSKKSARLHWLAGMILGGVESFCCTFFEERVEREKVYIEEITDRFQCLSYLVESAEKLREMLIEVANIKGHVVDKSSILHNLAKKLVIDVEDILCKSNLD
jgi:hypothetical protein